MRGSFGARRTSRLFVGWATGSERGSLSSATFAALLLHAGLLTGSALVPYPEPVPRPLAETLAPTEPIDIRVVELEDEVEEPERVAGAPGREEEEPDAFPPLPPLPDRAGGHGYGETDPVPPLDIEREDLADTGLDHLEPIVPPIPDLRIAERRARARRKAMLLTHISGVHGRGGVLLATLGAVGDPSPVGRVDTLVSGPSSLDKAFRAGGGGFGGTGATVAGRETPSLRSRRTYQRKVQKLLSAQPAWKKARARSEATRGVLLELRLSSTGGVVRVRVAMSSGDPGLDAGALRAARTARLPPPPAGARTLRLKLVR